METKIISHITKGLITVAVLIILDLVLQKTGATLPNGLQYLPTILLMAAVLVSCIIFANQSGGKLKFGDVFAHGFKTTAVIACLMAVYTFFAVKFIYPAPSAADLEAATKGLEQQGNMMPQEAKEKAVEAAKKMWIMVVSGVIFVSLVSGLIGSLAGALLAKKNQ
jgi:Protein of unknown function (DUF4199)